MEKHILKSLQKKMRCDNIKTTNEKIYKIKRGKENMNCKRTNYLVATLNAIIIIVWCCIWLIPNMLEDILYPMVNLSYNSYIKNPLISMFTDESFTLIEILGFTLIGMLNIICGFQNRNNKKLLFWQVLFGVYIIANNILSNIEALEDYKWIIIGIIPIIIVINNLLTCIKKHKFTRINIIEYIVTIILSIVYIAMKVNYEIMLAQIIEILWFIVLVIMQFIYIHNQEETVETQKRKICNIILYYIFQIICVVILLGVYVFWYGAIIYHYNKVESEIERTRLEIVNKFSASDEEMLLPVMKDKKWGYIDKNGNEKIECQYEQVSAFVTVEIENHKYSIALTMKDNKCNIISKDNKTIAIDPYLEKSLKMKYEENENENPYNRMSAFTKLIGDFIINFDISYYPINVEGYNNDNTYDLKKIKEGVYRYKSKNYYLDIEEVEDEDEYDNDEKETMCRVTVTKNNGEKNTYMEYLPRILYRWWRSRNRIT